MDEWRRRFGEAVAWLLTSGGLQWVGVCFSPMSPGPVWWDPEEESAPQTVEQIAEPPPLHPERLRADLPLTELELALERELGAAPWPLRPGWAEGEGTAAG